MVSAGKLSAADKTGLSQLQEETLIKNVYWLSMRDFPAVLPTKKISIFPPISENGKKLYMHEQPNGKGEPIRTPDPAATPQISLPYINFFSFPVSSSG